MPIICAWQLRAMSRKVILNINSSHYKKYISIQVYKYIKNEKHISENFRCTKLQHSTLFQLLFVNKTDFNDVFSVNFFPSSKYLNLLLSLYLNALIYLSLA